jgi:hypothetical protein
MGIFSQIKWKLTDIKDDIVIDLKYGDAKDRAKVIAKSAAFLYNPILYLGVTAGKKYIDNKIDEKIEDHVREKTTKMKAEHLAELNRLNRILEEMTPLEFYNFNVAGAALAFAVANADGELSDEEIEEIVPLLLGESSSAMPQNLRNIFNKFIESPPTFNEALEYVKKVDSSLWNSFDGIIEMTINIDNKVDDAEKAFYQQWLNFKKENGVC